MDKELNFLIYNTPEENVSINAVVKDETIWLTQKAMAELFDVGVPAISKHLKNIFEEGELVEEVVVSTIDWDDVVFEVDLLKSQEINLDYILDLILEKIKR